MVYGSFASLFLVPLSLSLGESSKCGASRSEA
jgi:hypothetical protein